MKAVTVYEANDGSRWETRQEAETRDLRFLQCQNFIRSLGLVPRPKRGSRYENGDGFIQQPRGVKLAILAFLTEMRWQPDEEIMDELRCRHGCLDDLDREWAQPFFVHHPEKAKAFCLNPTVAAANQGGEA